LRTQLGVNIFGFFSSVSGLAEAAWSTHRGITEAGLPARFIDIPLMDRPKHKDLMSLQGAVTYFPINVFHFNPDVIRLLLEDGLSQHYCTARYNIAFWFWETQQLPQYWVEAGSLFDEIWTSSDFCRDEVAKSIDKPVIKIPLNVVLTYARSARCARKMVRLPTEKYIFITMLDFMSNMERKNPLAAVDAFERAFGHDNHTACLVVKLLNATRGTLYKDLLGRLQRNPLITLIDEPLSRTDLASLLNASDCFVSLHRCEGFGLPIAEAMSLGKPVIATGWSANMEFMTAQNSFPVEFALKRLACHSLPYPRGTIWAEPSIEHASLIMRRLVKDPSIGEGIGRKAQQDISALISPSKTGEAIRTRLEEISNLLT